MSFGPSGTTQSGINTIGAATPKLLDINQQLGQNAGTANAYGQGLLNLGTSNTNAGANFFKTILGGDQAATSSLLQPNIDQIRGGQQQALQAASTLMPRGGGRSGALFNLPLQANSQIQSLFNGARSGAASALPQIGAGQTSVGSGLFGLGNQALGMGAGALGTVGQLGGNLAQIGQTQQQLDQARASALGSGLFGLATLPLGGFGGTALGALGGLFGGGGGGMPRGY